MRTLRKTGIWAASLTAVAAVLVILATEFVSLAAAVLGAVVRVVPNLSGSAARR